MAIHWGWQWAFIFVGLIGTVWLFFWYRIYASPEEKLKAGVLSQAEYDYINSDLDEKEDSKEEKGRVPWSKLLTYRQTWSFFFWKVTDRWSMVVLFILVTCFSEWR